MLAVVVIFGLMAAALLTLVVVPVLYSLQADLQGRSNGDQPVNQSAGWDVISGKPGERTGIIVRNAIRGLVFPLRRPAHSRQARQEAPADMQPATTVDRSE